MPTSFDWKFEEDSRPSRRPRGQTPQRRRWPRRGAVALVLLLIAGLGQAAIGVSPIE